MSSKYEPLIPASMAFNERGIPMSPRYGDVYHPAWGALAQARRVFLEGNGLPERWRGRDAFTVCETGFGLGHNFLALWQAWRDDPLRCGRLHMVSFEAHPFSAADLSELLLPRLEEAERRLARQLIRAWPALLPGLHRLEFEGGSLTLTLAFGSVERLAKQVSARVDAFFLDGFAPRVNPQMWSRQLFGQLVRMANSQATAATWCCAGEMRRSLAAAGFLVSKVKGHGGKREMTVASLRPGLGRSDGPFSRRPPASVIVVGGGLAGAGVAHALALRGIPSTVFDPAFALGPGGSHKGHLAAALTPSLSRDDDPRSRIARAGALRALARWQSFDEAARPWRCGTLEVVRNARQASEWRRALDMLRLPGEWVCWLDPDQARERTGVDLGAGGLWFSAGQVVKMEPLLEAMLASSQLRLLAQSVHAISQGATGLWQVHGADGRPLASAEHLVLAAAYRTPALLSNMEGTGPLPKLRAMYKMGGQVSYLGGPGAVDVRAILAGNGYCLPLVHGRTVVGSTYELDTESCRVTASGHDENLGKLDTLLGRRQSSMVDRDAVGGWAGWRAAVADRLPVIGPVAGAEGLWLACAYGSRGLSWCALAGDLIAAEMSGEPLPLERELLKKIAAR